MIKKIEKFGRHVGIYAENLRTGRIYNYNHRDIFPSASVIKLPIIYELFRNYINGKISPENTIFYKKEEYVEDSPWFENKAEGKYSLKEIAHSMITVSDNVSTNLLINLLKPNKINAIIKKIGMKNTVLNRKMCDFEARNKGIENTTTPEDMAIFFKRLIMDYGGLFSPDKIMNSIFIKDYNPANSALEIIKILTEQKDLEKIPSGICGAGILTANKPGELPGIRNDCALVITPDNNYIICIFSEKVYDETESDSLIAELSGLLFNICG